MLVITKEPEPQSTRLDLADFKAALLCMKGLNESFMFYNSGPIAGASQNHKHMQVVPIKSLPNAKIPIHERVMDAFYRSQVSEQGESVPETLVEDDLSQANYDNLSARKVPRHNQMFILPEY